MKGLLRKAGHLIQDPVLRRWLIRRIAGLERSPSGFIAGRPPYLDGEARHSSGGSDSLQLRDFRDGSFIPPENAIQIELPGQTIELSPSDPSALFSGAYDDLETELAAHRFAWVPVGGSTIDGNWVAALWRHWSDRFGANTTGWPWHAYTAAERAINIIDFSRRSGLPDHRSRISKLLTLHGQVILSNLEYYGDHYTSNHLSNNGRGLLRIGTALGQPTFAETGAKILIAEAGRIFGRSGILREGSTHYHQLLARNYIDAWVDAKFAGLEQAEILRSIAERALGPLPGLSLQGGIPLIGDISPDVSPAYLDILGGKGSVDTWPANLSDDRQQEARNLIRGLVAVSPDVLAEDGWHRFGSHQWQALTFVSPDGWPPMPGHGHNDLGSFQLHDGETPIFSDPGRGSYAGSLYADATVHNGVIIDDTGPMPVNRAYYGDGFRRRIVPNPPELRRTRDGCFLSAAGFQHIPSIETAERQWHFTERSLSIVDRFSGRRHHKISRQFCTPHRVETRGGTAMIDAGSSAYRLKTDGDVSVREITLWSEYGRGQPATQIVSETRRRLPVELETTLERI